MKTLYVNINNEQIQSNEELEVLNYDLDSDFFFYLGEKIAKGCKVENEIALITDFNTQDAADDYQKIIAQWNEIKAILFSEECDDDYEFKLPAGYIHWLKYHPQYVSVYDKNFSHGESGIIYIDLEELYEESVESMQRRILRKLQRDDLYRDIDEIVFNDDAINRKSPIVRTVKDKYDGIGFKAYKKCLEGQKEKNIPSNEDVSEEKEIMIVNQNFPIDITERYSDIKPFSEGVAAVLNGSWGYIDENCNEIIPCIFDEAMSFVDGETVVKIDHLAICIDKQGRIIQKAQNYRFPINYHNRAYHEGLCAICFGKHQWGFCDKSGKIITTEKFSKVSDFRNGIAEVYGHLGTCYINTDGVFVDDVEGRKLFYQTEVINNSIFEKLHLRKILGDNNRIGYIDLQGNELIPCIYDEIIDMNDGYVIAKIYNNNSSWFRNIQSMFLYKLDNKI